MLGIVFFAVRLVLLLFFIPADNTLDLIIIVLITFSCIVSFSDYYGDRILESFDSKNTSKNSNSYKIKKDFKEIIIYFFINLSLVTFLLNGLLSGSKYNYRSKYEFINGSVYYLFGYSGNEEKLEYLKGFFNIHQNSMTAFIVSLSLVVVVLLLGFEFGQYRRAFRRIVIGFSTLPIWLIIIWIGSFGTTFIVPISLDDCDSRTARDASVRYIYGDDEHLRVERLTGRIRLVESTKRVVSRTQTKIERFTYSEYKDKCQNPDEDYVNNCRKFAICAGALQQNLSIPFNENYMTYDEIIITFSKDLTQYYLKPESVKDQINLKEDDSEIKTIEDTEKNYFNLDYKINLIFSIIAFSFILVPLLFFVTKKFLKISPSFILILISTLIYSFSIVLLYHLNLLLNDMFFKLPDDLINFFSIAVSFILASWICGVIIKQPSSQPIGFIKGCFIILVTWGGLFGFVLAVALVVNFF